MLCNLPERGMADSPRGVAAAQQAAAGHMRQVVIPLRARHRLTPAPRLDDADRGAVPADDQRTFVGDIDDRAGISARRGLDLCAKHLDVEIGDLVEPGHVGRRGERLVVSGADEIDDALRAVVPVDAPVQASRCR